LAGRTSAHPGILKDGSIRLGEENKRSTIGEKLTSAFNHRLNLSQPFPHICAIMADAAANAPTRRNLTQCKWEVALEM
jgi:hypothetical protein